VQHPALINESIKSDIASHHTDILVHLEHVVNTGSMAEAVQSHEQGGATVAGKQALAGLKFLAGNHFHFDCFFI
jgi:hypothetical protein